MYPKQLGSCPRLSRHRQGIFTIATGLRALCCLYEMYRGVLESVWSAPGRSTFTLLGRRIVFFFYPRTKKFLLALFLKSGNQVSLLLTVLTRNNKLL
jgi:hypothetical protein